MWPICCKSPISCIYDVLTRRIAEVFKLGLVWGYTLTQMLYYEREVSFHISTKTHLLEVSTFSRLPFTLFCYIVAFNHVGHWDGLKFIKKWSMRFKISWNASVLNERPRDISLVQLRAPSLPCLPERDDVSVCYYRPFQIRKKTTSLFKQHMTKSINK